MSALTRPTRTDECVTLAFVECEGEPFQCRTRTPAAGMAEGQITNGEPFPLRRPKGLCRCPWLGNSVPNDVCTGVVCVLACEGLEMQGDGCDYTRRLLRVFPYHVKATQQQRLAWTAAGGRVGRLLVVFCYQAAVQHACRQVHGAPLRLV